MMGRLEKLKAENIALQNSVIYLALRSMRDNLIFYNVEEKEGENTTALIHKILEKRLDIENMSTKVIIDRSHRMGRKS